MGALDLIAALEWVRDNAAAFGGDPANVTIFGQSGGGGKVATVQSMPAAKGLFHRMIIGSTLGETGITGTPKDEALKWTEVYLRRLGLKPNQAEELRKFSAETLVAAMAGTGPDSGTDGDLSLRLVPVVDGKTMPVDPFDPAAPEVSADIPLMTGSVETESVPYGVPSDPYWTTNEIDEAGLREQVKRTLRVENAVADRIVGVYKEGRPKASNIELATIIASDASGTREAGYVIAERKAKQGKAPAYLYYFKWYSPLRDGKVRCMHSMELPFVFDHVDAAQWMTGQDRNRYALAERVSGTWVAFARAGNPNHKGLPKWNPFNAEQRPTMVFDNECNGVDDPHREEPGNQSGD